MNEIRYIQNPFAKIFNIVNPDRHQLYNLLLKLLQEFFQQVKVPTLLAYSSIPAKSKEDIQAYVGASGYLVMLLKVHSFFRQQDEKETSVFQSKSHIVGDEHINQLTDPSFFLKMAQEQYHLLQNHILSRKRSNSCFSFFCSEVAVWTCGMHLAYRTRNPALFRENQYRIRRCFDVLRDNIDKQFWELLYGVPGFLFALLELQKNYDKADELFQTNFSPQIVELTHMVIRQGITNYQKTTGRKVVVQQLPEDFRLVYHFHKSQYLGGAHGLAGNLNIILTAMKYNDFGKETATMINLIRKSVEFLLKHLINGNFSVKANSKHIKLVHFCHGATGTVITLAKFYMMFPEIAIAMGVKEVIQTNLDHIWKYGVLKKGFGLCHGISGNAYPFITPSIQEVLPERTAQLLKKAEFFALLHEQPGVLKQIRQYNFEDRLIIGRSDEPYSLMVGSAGDICLVVDVLSGRGGFPGYDID